MEPTFQINTAQSADYERIVALLTEVNLLTNDILAPHSQYWVAEADDGQLAACAGLELGGEAVLFRSLAVYPEFRQKGLAVRLIDHALSFAQSNGYKRVYCFSTRAGEYFRQIGFHPVTVDELAQTLPNAPQVKRFAAIGKLAGERAWCKGLRE